jgi:hypothetical protein
MSLIDDGHARHLQAFSKYSVNHLGGGPVVRVWN